MHVFTRLPRCATYTAIFLLEWVQARAPTRLMLVWRISWLHAHQACKGPRYSPINICTWGYREISWKRPTPSSYAFSIRSRYLVLVYWYSMGGACTTLFVRMCDGRSYNREKGGRDVGVFALAEENLIFGRKRGDRRWSLEFYRN